jgi:hypothetical protein
MRRRFRCTDCGAVVFIDLTGDTRGWWLGNGGYGICGPCCRRTDERAIAAVAHARIRAGERSR